MIFSLEHYILLILVLISFNHMYTLFAFSVTVHIRPDAHQILCLAFARCRHDN